MPSEGAVRLPEAIEAEFGDWRETYGFDPVDPHVVDVRRLLEAAYRAGQEVQPLSKADWGAFLRERHLLILEWTADGQSPEQIAHTLSMDPMQVQLIAMTPEESTRPHARPAGAPEGGPR